MYQSEILAAIFGWEPWGVKWTTWGTPAGCSFSPNAIGEREYNVRHAVLSRSIASLEKRGLVHIYQGFRGEGAGLTLTDSGVQVARMLEWDDV